MQRLLYIVLFAIAVIFGQPYASLILHRMIGTVTAEFHERDGRTSRMISGPAVPRPDWLPIQPGTLVVTAARWLTDDRYLDSGSIDLLTHSGLDTLKSYYSRELEGRGFVIDDYGNGDVSPMVAAYLGMDGMLLAERTNSRHEVSVSFSTPQGLVFGPRLVKIQWRELKPDQASTFEAYRKAGLPRTGQPG